MSQIVYEIQSPIASRLIYEIHFNIASQY